METEIRRLMEREEELHDVLSYARLIAYGHFTAGQKILINQERAGILRAIDFMKKKGIEPDRYIVPESIERAVKALSIRMRSKKWVRPEEQGIL